MSSVTLRRRPGSREAEIVAGVEDQPLGEGLARRFVEEQHLKQPLGQLLAAEGERWHQRIPRLVVALRAAAVHHEPQSARQPVASRTDGDYEGRVGGVDAQHEGIVLGIGEFEAVQTSLPVGELGHVAPSGTGRELHAADTRMACAQGVDEVALVVEQPPLREARASVVAQRLEAHTAGVSVDQIAPFGEEGYIEALAPALLARGFSGVSQAAYAQGLAKEVVLGEVAHEERVGAQGVVARGVGGQGQVSGVDAVASEDLDAAHERSAAVVQFDVEVAAVAGGGERRGVDAVGAQPHRVARDVVLLVGMDVEFLLRVAGKLLDERRLRGRDA